MIRVLIISILLIFHIGSFAQTDFFKTYNLGESNHSTFYDMIIENDTITAIGVQYSSEGQIGILWCEMDTLGNILNLKTHFDPTGDDLYITSAHQVTRTSDGGYLIPGQFFYKSNPFLLKLDRNGEKEFLREYTIFENYSSRHQKIIETNSHYISIGRTINPTNNFFKAFIMFLNKNGNMEDIIYYEHANLNTYLARIDNINNEIILSGSASNFGAIDNNQAISKYLQISLDTFGNEISNKLHSSANLSNYVSYPISFVIDNDSNYIIAGAEWSVDDFDEVYTCPTIVSRDKDLNIVWKTNIGGFTFPLNVFTDIIIAQDNTYIVSGNYLKYNENDVPIYSGSIISKVAHDGTEVWTRTDSIPDHDPQHTISYITETVELSSGSLMSCGYYIDNELGEVAATLFKFDKNGCMNGDCDNVVLSIEQVEGNKIKIGPNPFQEKLFLSAPFPFTYSLFSQNGQILEVSKDQKSQFELDMTKYPASLYFLQLKIGKGLHIKQIVKH